MSMANQSDCVCTCEVLQGSAIFRNAICFGGGVCPSNFYYNRKTKRVDGQSFFNPEFGSC